MRKTFKKLLALGAVIMSSVMAAYPITATYTVGAGTAWNATNLIPNSARITGVAISTGGAGGVTNLTYVFNDFPGFNAANGWGNIKQTNAGYMASGRYSTNILKIQTNFGGVYTNADGTTNWAYISNASWTYTNYVGATSNSWRVIASGTVASNSTTTLSLPSGGLPVIYGLGFTNNNVGVDVTLVITYNNSL